MITRQRPRPRVLLALGLYTAMAVLTSELASRYGLPLAWLSVLVVCPLALAVRDRPVAFGLLLAAGGVWLRLLFLQTPPTADQMVVSHAASLVALAGGNPYAVAYPESIPPGAPFPYGPLALVIGQLGQGTEVLAAAATMVLLAFTRSLLTLALYASFFFAVMLTSLGPNDVLPGLLLTTGMLALAFKRPVWAGVLLALGAGIKPYVFAWAPGAFAVGGISLLVALAAVSAVAWLPLLLWGPLSFLDALERARNVHSESANTFNVPALRVLAIPLAVLALFARRWDLAVLSGLAIFLVVLFFDRWASWGYLLAVAPLAGILVEWRPPATVNRPVEQVAEPASAA